MAEVTVKEVKSLTEKLRLVTFEQGPDMRFWADEAFSSLLTPGATVKVAGEKKPQKNDPSKEEYWVKSVNGTAGKAAKGGGGGGGFRNAPKGAQEIHSASICGIIKSCIETGKATAEADNWIELYLIAMAKVKA